MRILLVVPYQKIEPYVLPNLGLGYLASALRNKGHEVVYLDCVKNKIKPLAWENFLREGQFELIGIQMYSYAYGTVNSMFKAAKEVLPEVINVVGGPHANAIPEQTLRDSPEIDYVIHGEGERSLPDLIDILENGFPEKRPSISNLTWRDNGYIRVNEKSFIDDLDNLALPAWDLMDPRTYPILSHGLFNRANPIAPIFATRGCPYSCTFCSSKINMGNVIRKRNPSKIVDEIEMLVKEYGVKEIHFEDDNFTFFKHFASEICQIIIDRGIKVWWACPNGVRVDSLDAELLSLMERSGCYSFALGIESGSDRVLSLMKKGTNVRQMRDKVRLIAETTNIRITGFFMLGFPGEDESDVKKTEAFVLREPFDRLAIGPFIPLPGTSVYEDLVKEKKIPEKNKWHSLSPYSKDFLIVGQFSRKKIFRLMRCLLLKFYLRPRIIMDLLSEIHSAAQLKALLKVFLLWAGIVKVSSKPSVG